MRHAIIGQLLACLILTFFPSTSGQARLQQYAQHFGQAKGHHDTALDSPSRVRVTCTTTLLSAIVKAVGKDNVDVSTIVPFGMCPGHFDISPGEVEKIRASDIVLAHGYERFLKKFTSNAFHGSDNKIIKICVEGNWMIPDIQKRAAQKITGILVEKLPHEEAALHKNLSHYESQIDRLVKNLQNTLAAFCGTAVACSTMNEEFVKWLGMNVVTTFPRDEDISVKSMNRVIITARKEKAKLVIDNKQSTGKVGKTIAYELSVPLVVLSNFPSLSKKGDPYIETLKQNCEAAKAALD